MTGFWIPQARQAVKTVLSKCIICKKYSSFAFKYPELSNLPNLVNLYEKMGINYIGHLWVHRNGKAEKMYLLIFICLALMNIHVEIVQDMVTKAFVQALIRFCISCGVATHMYSDKVRSFNNAFGKDIIEHHLNEFNETFINHTIKHMKYSCTPHG